MLLVLASCLLSSSVQLLINIPLLRLLLKALNDFIKLAPEDRGPAQEMIELFFTCGRENSDSRDENNREIEES